MSTLFGWISALLEVLGLLRRKEAIAVEPLLDGYKELKDGFVVLTETFTKQISGLNSALADAYRERKQLKKTFGEQFGKQKREIEDCHRHRHELQKRVVVLEEKATEERDYTHSRVHEFENYMKFLEMDLTEVGIDPVARASIVRLQKERHERADRND